MKSLSSIIKKKEKLIIGLMSGTSLDGVDTLLCSIKGSSSATKIKVIDFFTLPFPKGLKEEILKNSIPGKGSVDSISSLNALLAHIYAKAVLKIIAKNNLTPADIDLIGSHGQTIQHIPQKQKLFGYNIASTLQIGDPAVLAKLTGITTIGDFRTGDIALGGQGAPLVPYFDYVMFSHKDKIRALLNIGGISNITVLPNKNSNADLIAFDCGPGNMLIDILVKRFCNKEYDKDGKIAFSGKINSNLLKILIENDSFLNKRPPKSSGREYYNDIFVKSTLKNFKRIPPEDIIATFSDYTAFSVFNNYKKYILKKLPVSELFVSGGGAKNKFIIKSLQNYFGKSILIDKFEKLGLSSDLKEALCFAVFANETIAGNPVNLPCVTGASDRTILGKICLP